MRRACFLAVLAVMAILAYRISMQRTPDAGAVVSAAGCTCALERTRNGWCESCGVGWVDQTMVRSKLVYETLDLHGHDIDARSLPCERCREAVETDGFCEKCGRGFLGGRAYLSSLSYHLARGERAVVEDDLRLLALALETVERCELCAAAMVIDGNCPKCRVSYRDRNKVSR